MKIGVISKRFCCLLFVGFDYVGFVSFFDDVIVVVVYVVD